MAMRDDSVLRCEIALGGMIIGEKNVSPRSSLMVGLLDDGVQGELVRLHELFRYVEGGYCLCLTGRMSGRISDESSLPPCLLPPSRDVKDFMNRCQSKDGVWEIRLGPRARGKIQIGDFTICFRLVSTLN